MTAVNWGSTAQDTAGVSWRCERSGAGNGEVRPQTYTGQTGT